MDESVTRRLLLSMGGAGLAGLAGCVGSTRDVEDSISERVDPDDADALTVSGGAGTIDVRGDSRDDVAIEGTKRAASQDDLERFEIEIDRRGQTIEISTEYEQESWFQLSPSPVVDLEIVVPAALRVSRAAIGSGDLQVSAVDGPVEADVGSGTLTVTDVDGDLTAESGSGDQTLTAIDGSVTATAGSGSVLVECDPLAGDVEIETGSGDVDLSLGSTPDAEITASTGSGSVSTDGPEFAEPTDDSPFTTLIGDGTYTVDISTGSGDVIIRTQS